MVIAIGQKAWRTFGEQARVLDDRALAEISPFVVLAPHPDDETLGCGGLLAVASRCGLDPHVVFLTDGGASHLGSESWPRSRLVGLRQDEARSALAELGVPSDRALFLDWADADPYPAGSAAFDDAAVRISHWIAPRQPRAIFAPWPGEAHCDHQAAALLAERLARSQSIRRFEYLVWGWGDATVQAAYVEHQPWRLDCPTTTGVRGKALARHRSQLGEMISDAREAFQIPAELRALTARPYEIYFEQL